ncbi:MAG: hypothetical protein ACREJ2_15515 [Planctomycetota bacterium]
MQFQTRFPQVAERFARFWRGEETDRPVLYLTAPKDRPDRSVPAPHFERPADRITPENMLAVARHRLATTAYLAEGFPHHFTNYGPGILHGCIGGEADFSDPNTVWFPSFLKDISEFPALEFQPHGRWWQTIVATTELVLDKLGDDLLLSLTDIGGNADVVASAVGPQQMLLDCIDRPEAVRAAVWHSHRLWWQAYERHFALLNARQDFITPWWPVIYPGRTYMTQCDFNAMIGPRMFADLFADELGALWKGLAMGCYHLDGLGTESQVPALLARRRNGLGCIQWVPAPGHSPLEHAAMLRSIQAAGVNITFVVKPAEVEAMCRAFDIRRLMMHVTCPSETAARQLLADVERCCQSAEVRAPIGVKMEQLASAAV